MKIPKELHPKPHKLKKGETVGSVLKKRGFSSKSARDLLRDEYNKHLKAYADNPDEVPVGETVYIPVYTQKELSEIISMSMKIGFNASSALKVDEYEQRIDNLKSAIESLEKEVEIAKVKLRPADKELMLANQYCTELLKKTQKGIPAIAQCAVDMSLWQKALKDEENDAVSELKSLQSAFSSAKANLSTNQTKHKIVQKLAAGIEKKAAEAEAIARAMLSVTPK